LLEDFSFKTTCHDRVNNLGVDHESFVGIPRQHVQLIVFLSERCSFLHVIDQLNDLPLGVLVSSGAEGLLYPHARPPNHVCAQGVNEVSFHSLRVDVSDLGLTPSKPITLDELFDHVFAWGHHLPPDRARIESK
jgi:hypothetical protein